MATTQQRGVAMVEWALVLPLLLTLIFGMLQFGSILSTSLSLRRASAVAARQAALFSYGNVAQGASSMLTTAQVDAVTALARSVSGIQSPGTPPVVSVNQVSLGSVGTGFEVRIQYDLPLFTRYVIPGNALGQFPLSSQAIFR